METQPPSSPTRPGTPGLDVFKIAGHSISGFVHSFKTGDPRRVRQPFTSRLEEQLSMFLEYHPHVRFYQRGDASPACANTYGLVTELGTPYRINYVFDGKPHEYLPDYVGMLCDGGLLIAEAGRESEKSKGKALVKAEAARRLALLKGECTGWAQRPICQNAVIRTGCICMPAVNPFLPIRRLPKPFSPTSLGVRCPLFMNWSSALALAGPKPKSKRLSGNW